MSARLMQILASLAQRRALRGLDVICETQHQISTRKLEQYLHQIDNELSSHAHYLRIEYDALTRKVAEQEAENAKLRAELERLPVDGWKLVPVEPTPEMVSAAEEAHMPFGDMDIALRMAILAAPSAPKADAVKVQLLEALTDSLELMETLCAFEGDTIRKARAAIAAARKGEGE